MFKSATVTFREKFSRSSGQRMGHELIRKLGHKPKALWLFCAPENGLEDLLRGISEAAGSQNLVGCTTDGEISDQGFSTCSAVLTGIASDQVDFETAFVENISQDSEKAGRDLAMRFPRTVRYTQVFSDGLTGNGSEILRGIASVLGEHIPVAGGLAGDAGKFLRTLQFAGEKVMSDAAVAIGFSGNFHVGTGLHSGWSPIGLAKKVTRASGKILYELNGEPALKVYEKFLGKHAEKLPEVGVEYPLAVSGKYYGKTCQEDFNVLRATMSVNRQDGSITFAGDIPEGATVHLACADRPSILKSAKEAALQAMAGLENALPVMVFCYSCMARKIVLGRHTREELGCIRQEIGADIPVAGFYTYGEYSRVRPDGPNLLHNETVSVSVLGI